MKRIMFIAALLLVAGTFSACATGEALSGKDVVKGYALNGAYTELEVGNAITAVISTEADSVYVTTDKDFIDYVSVRQDRGKLSLEVSPAMKYRFAGGMPDIKVIVPVSNSLEGMGHPRCHPTVLLQPECLQSGCPEHPDSVPTSGQSPCLSTCPGHRI